MKEVLTHRKQFITIDDTQVYKRCRVQLYGNGIVLRDEVKGIEIKTKKQQICRPEDFLVAEIDAKFGGYGIVPTDLENAIVSGHYFLFGINREKLRPDFLALIIKLNQFAEQVQATGSTNYAAIRPSHVLEYSIPLPPIDIQKSLVTEYQATLRKAELQEVEAVQLEAKTDTYLLEELGISFAANAITSKGLFFTEYQNVERWSVDYCRNQNSVSQLKKGSYPTQKIRHLLTYIQYGLSLKASVDPVGYPLIRMNNIQDGRLNIGKLKYLNIQKEEIKNSFLKPGDLLFNRTNSKELVGKTAVFNLEGDYTFASYLIRMRVDEAKANVYYINYLFNSKIGRTQIDQISRQVLGQANVNSQELQDFLFPIPPLTIQDHIVVTLNDLKFRAQTLRIEAVELRQNAINDFEKFIFITSPN